ncbi:replication protein A 70 kDa DNA-binding subunit C [Trifolium repens]|nr:replication protein A 70 kDa DNA-binding subunit C [Trifolium repens]
MVDVVGVATHIKHDKNFYPDGKVTRSVTFKLSDERNAFYCELVGDLVDDFHKKVMSFKNGFPIVVLQFVRVACLQGSVMVQGVEGVTKVFVTPWTAGVMEFRKRLIQYLSRSSNYGGLIRRSTLVPLSRNLEFVQQYPVKTIFELKNDPALGTFIVSARMLDIVRLDPWWYPVCDCPKIFEGYIGAFYCTTCRAKEYTVAPKVRLTIEVEDITGFTVFNAFDHVMVDVAVVDSRAKAINTNQFYEAFWPVMGKSMMFIVKKTTHEHNFLNPNFELIRVSSNEAVLKYFYDKGVYIAASKVVKKRLESRGKEVVVPNPINHIHTTEELLDEYVTAAVSTMPDEDVGCSSGSKRTKV